MSSFFVYYNHLGDVQVIAGMTELFARNMLNLTGQINRFKMQTSPTALEIASIVHTGEIALAAFAITAYGKTDPDTKPVNRARRAFKEAFGRAANTKDRPYEAEALTEIVQGYMKLTEDTDADTGSDPSSSDVDITEPLVGEVGIDDNEPSIT